VIHYAVDSVVFVCQTSPQLEELVVGNPWIGVLLQKTSTAVDDVDEMTFSHLTMRMKSPIGFQMVPVAVVAAAELFCSHWTPLAASDDRIRSESSNKLLAAAVTAASTSPPPPPQLLKFKLLLRLLLAFKL